MRLVIEHDDGSRVVLGNGEGLLKAEKDLADEIAEEILQLALEPAVADPWYKRSRTRVAATMEGALRVAIPEAVRKVLSRFKRRTLTVAAPRP